MSALDVSARYLDATWTGKADSVRDLIAEDVRFQGPFRAVPLEGKTRYFETGEYLQPLVRGYELLHRWADETDVCSILNVKLESELGAGTLLITEWHKVDNGQIVETRIIFDTAKYHALIPNRPSVIT